MIYHRIVDLIGHQPERLTNRWCDHIMRSNVTKSYRRLTSHELATRHLRVFQNLALWLQQSISREQVNRFFYELGRERYLEGFPLCEVNYALLVAKRDFWDLIHSQGLLNSSLEFYQAMELMSSIDQFFDLGNFYIIRGYLQAMYSKLEKSAHLSSDQLKALVLTADPDVHPEGMPGRV